MRKKIAWASACALSVLALGSAFGEPAAADVDCADFSSQNAAQDHLIDYPGDPDLLDADNDGVACEWPRDKEQLWLIGVYAGVLAGILGASWTDIVGDNDAGLGMSLFALGLGTALIGFIPALLGVGIAENWTPPAWTATAILLLAGTVGVVVGVGGKLLMDKYA